MDDFVVHLPAPSDPLPDEERPNPPSQYGSNWVVRCEGCGCSWHGNPCRSTGCKCLTSAKEL